MIILEISSICCYINCQIRAFLKIKICDKLDPSWSQNKKNKSSSLVKLLLNKTWIQEQAYLIGICIIVKIPLLTFDSELHLSWMWWKIEILLDRTKTISCIGWIFNNISSVVEFQRWWVLKSKIFAMWWPGFKDFI